MKNLDKKTNTYSLSCDHPDCGKRTTVAADASKGVSWRDVAKKKGWKMIAGNEYCPSHPTHVRE